MPNARIVNTPNQAIPQGGTTHTQITISSSAVNLSSSLTLNGGTTHVLIQPNGANVRATFDGSTAPTASKGFKLTNGSASYWTPQMFNDAQLIREGATNATLEVQELNFI